MQPCLSPYASLDRFSSPCTSSPLLLSRHFVWFSVQLWTLTPIDFLLWTKLIIGVQHAVFPFVWSLVFRWCFYLASHYWYTFTFNYHFLCNSTGLLGSDEGISFACTMKGFCIYSASVFASVIPKSLFPFSLRNLSRKSSCSFLWRL